MAQSINNLSEVQEIHVQSLAWEDPLEKEMTTYSSILPEKPHGQRSLAGYSLWGCKSRTQLSDKTTTVVTFEGEGAEKGKIPFSKGRSACS